MSQSHGSNRDIGIGKGLPLLAPFPAQDSGLHCNRSRDWEELQAAEKLFGSFSLAGSPTQRRFQTCPGGWCPSILLVADRRFKPLAWFGADLLNVGGSPLASSDDLLASKLLSTQLAISDEEPEVIRRYLAKSNIVLPMLVDTERKVFDLYNVPGIPATKN